MTQFNEASEAWFTRNLARAPALSQEEREYMSRLLGYSYRQTISTKPGLNGLRPRPAG